MTEENNNPKLLITGASGYLASHLVSELNGTIAGLVRKAQRRLEEGSKKAQYIEYDICSKETIELDYDICVHTAYCNDLEAEKFFLNQLNKNSYLVFFSSAAVYGEMKDAAFAAEDSPAPINDYGRYKLDLEKFILENFANHLILRIANPYGKEPRPKGVYQIFKSKLEQKQVLELNCNEIGEMIRDFIYIDDAIEQISTLVKEKAQGIHNISSGSGTSLEDFARMVAKEINYQGEIKFQYNGYRDGEIRKSILTNNYVPAL